MYCDREIEFFEQVLKELHIQSARLKSQDFADYHADFGLRKFVYGKNFVSQLYDLYNQAKDNTFYRICDEFACGYILFLLPRTDEYTVFIAGPFLNYEITREELLKKAAELKIAPEQEQKFETFFSALPVLSESTVLFAMLMALGAKLWGADSFEVSDINLQREVLKDENENGVQDSDRIEQIELCMKLLEDRYACENEIMELVSKGHAQRAELVMRSFSELVIENRTHEPMRNAKNYGIILNTLLRKAAERGGAHPLYIDALSSSFARKIEAASSWSGFSSLLQNMIKEYCQLVRKHSVARFSPLVQKVIARIDLDLTADLRLRTFSKQLNVSEGYLSGLFRREVGRTLTDFVNCRRMEYAAYLLKNTELLVSDIAQKCGIGDDNYFSKLFKKHSGMTPSQFRGNARL